MLRLSYWATNMSFMKCGTSSCATCSHSVNGGECVRCRDPKYIGWHELWRQGSVNICVGWPSPARRTPTIKWVFSLDLLATPLLTCWSKDGFIVEAREKLLNKWYEVAKWGTSNGCIAILLLAILFNSYYNTKTNKTIFCQTKLHLFPIWSIQLAINCHLSCLSIVKKTI